MSDVQLLNVISHAEFSIGQLETLYCVSSEGIRNVIKNANIPHKNTYTFKEACKIGSLIKPTNDKEVICIANDKGGVGKTLLSYQMSQKLQLDGKRVLVVDLDGQRNLTKFFVRGDTELSMVNYFSKEMHSTLDSICINIDDTLSIIPSNKNVGRLNTVLDRALYFDSKALQFKDDINLEVLLDFINNFNSFISEFDVVLIDSAPNFGLSNFLAFTVATKIVVPTEPERHNLDGVNAVIDFASLVEETLGSKEKLAISFFFNQSRPVAKDKTIGAKSVIQSTVENYGYKFLDTELPYSEFFYISNRDGVPFWLASIENPEEEDIEELKMLLLRFNNMLKELNGEEISVMKKSVEKEKVSFKAMW